MNVEKVGDSVLSARVKGELQSQVSLKTTILKQVNEDTTQEEIELRNHVIRKFLIEEISQKLLGYESEITLGESDSGLELDVMYSSIPGAIKLTSSFGSSLGIPAIVDVGPQLSQRDSIDGFEKIVATCNVLGETNYSAGNLLVKNSTVIKIEHDSSILTCHNTFGSLIKSIYINFITFKHNTKIHNLTFDVTKYYNSLTQILSQLNSALVCQIIDNAVAKLKTSGFNPNGLIVTIKECHDKFSKVKIETFNQLKKVYDSAICKNFNVLTEVAEKIKIVTMFNNTPFKEGKWLKAFATLESEINVIDYAIKHEIKIDSKCPSLYKKIKIQNQYLYIAPEDIIENIRNDEFIQSVKLSLFAASVPSLNKFDKPQRRKLYETFVEPIFDSPVFLDIGFFHYTITHWEEIVECLKKLVDSHMAKVLNYKNDTQNLPSISSDLYSIRTHIELKKPKFLEYDANTLHSLLEVAVKCSNTPYKIFILNIFETSKLLPEFLRPEACPLASLVKSCANDLYTQLHYKHKLDPYFNKPYALPLLNNLGLTKPLVIKILKVLQQTGIIPYIQKYAFKGQWDKDEQGVEYYTDKKIFLKEKVLPIVMQQLDLKCKEEEVLDNVMVLCFEAINGGIMLASSNPNPICSIRFAEENPILIQSILKKNPEYFVSPFIKGMFDSSTTFPLEQKKCALSPFLLEILERSDFANKIKRITKVSLLSNDNCPEAQVEILVDLAKYVEQIKRDLKIEQYVVNILHQTAYANVSGIFIIMQCVISDYLKSLIKTASESEEEDGLDAAALSCLTIIEESLALVTCKPSITQLLQEFFLENKQYEIDNSQILIIGEYACDVDVPMQ